MVPLKGHLNYVKTEFLTIKENCGPSPCPCTLWFCFIMQYVFYFIFFNNCFVFYVTEYVYVF